MAEMKMLTKSVREACVVICHVGEYPSGIRDCLLQVPPEMTVESFHTMVEGELHIVCSAIKETK